MIGIPSVAVFNITYRCQLRCKICNIKNTSADLMDLDTEQIIAILEDLSRSGISTIDFVGGEALLKEDIVEILKAARLLFKEVKIVTNGVLGLVYADLFLSLPVDQITISLDGGNSKTHDDIRGDGVFDKVTEFLGFLKQNKVRFAKPFTTINTVIIMNNVTELLDILFLADSLHCNNITYEVFLRDNVNLRQKKMDSLFWVTGDVLQCLDSQIKKIVGIKEAHSTVINVASTIDYLNNIVSYYDDTLKPNLFTCRNGLDFITITSDGRVTICDYTLGNVVGDNFLTIWNSEKTGYALRSVARCARPCMMNCMVGGVENYGKNK